jgi:glycosyltransferase involved in cell wall biosynthesis
VRVVHVITHEGAAYRLHVGLRRAGIDSRMLVAESRTNERDPSITEFLPRGGLLRRLRRRLRSERIRRGIARYEATRPEGYGYFFDDRDPHGAELWEQIPPCDLVHVHTMYRLVDFGAFFAAAPPGLPLVRTLHDMSFFTGGCHHDWGCSRYTDRCGACPQLGSHHEHDLSRQIWQRKRAALSALGPRRLHVVAPSRWMAETARRSTLLREFPMTVIPLGLDTEVFRPRNRDLAREILGVPRGASIVLFVGDPIDRPEKGFALLARALDGLVGVPRPLLVSLGRGPLPCGVPTPHLRLGYVGNERMLALVYSAADVCAAASLRDNLPFAVLESLACGTPIAGFATGGIPEMVRPGVTGLLAPVGDAAALGAAIGALLRDPARRAEMSAHCRRIAVEEYSLECQAARHITLYEAILNNAREGQSPATARRCGERLPLGV